ncbi:HNH endonuclease [Nocardia farcinica]|uniref:HNH endonuclease n=1 Tax=Nocardia farcinica TaxID=37329 RepID=UPI0019A400E7|nr:HNH endonuclease [Nocardia farcinica]MBC9819455.1 HNH endonuclease [Nocardia farcinica]
MVTTATEGRRIVDTRCGGRCERCGQPGYTIHHRRKRSQGGTWDASNLLALCGSGTTACHGWVEANPRAAHMLGFWLRHGEQSATTPVWLWGRWVQLDDNGHIHEVEAA